MDTDFIIRYIRNRHYVLINETTAQQIKTAYEAAVPNLNPTRHVPGARGEGQDLVMGGTRYVNVDLLRLHEDYVRAQAEGWQAIEIPETPERMKALKDLLLLLCYLHDERHLLIGERMAELALKELLGSEMTEHGKMFTLRGRDMISGMPAALELSAAEARDVLKRYYDQERDGNRASAE